MFRYLLWRLSFELCNIRRLLGHGPERVKYLAFGANLSEAVLRERRISPLAVEHFTLRDHGLRFDHPSAWAGCGYASVDPAPGESVYGYLYTLSGRDAARMDFYEGVPVISRYRKTWVQQDGERLFFYQTNLSTPGLKPTAEYLGYIVEGLRSHPQVEQNYLQTIAATGTVVPGKLLGSYLWRQPEQRNPLLRRTIGVYQLIVVFVFRKFLYPCSATAPLIRRRGR